MFACVVALQTSAAVAITKPAPPRKAPLAVRCGLISEIFSPTGLAPLRDYIRNSCVQTCVDDRILVDVVMLPVKPDARETLGPWFASGEACKGDTFSVLTADRRPTEKDPTSVLQVVLTPSGRNRYDLGVRIAGYSPSEGPHGIALCGEFYGTAEYHKTKWQLKESAPPE